jgi:outer membrane protein assembly factor BamB
VLGLFAVRGWAQSPDTAPSEPRRVIAPATDQTDAVLAWIDAMVRATRFDDAADFVATLLADPAAQLASRSGWSYPDWSLIDVRREVEARMAAWPAEALRAYQSKVGLEASDALEQARTDVTRLRQLLDCYLFTDAAVSAGLRLIALDWREGRFVQAARTARRLLLRPLPPTDRAQVLVELAFAEAMSARRADAERVVRQLHAEHGGETVLLGGRRTRVTDLTGDNLPLPPRVVVNTRRCTDFGDKRCNGLNVVTDLPATLAWQSRLPVRPQVGSNDQSRRRLADWLSTLSGRGALLVNNAVVTDTGLVINRGHELLSLKLDDGSTPDGWKQSHPPDGVLRGKMPESTRWMERMGYANAVAPYFAIVADDRHVVAITGIEDRLPGDADRPPREQQRLWCLDPSSGQIAWSRTPSELLANRVPDGCYFSGALAIDGEQVLAFVRGPLRSPSQSGWLISLDREDGRIRWLTPLGSALLMGTRLAVPEFESCYVAHLAVADGRVFLNTNLGSVVAVEIESGRVAWMSGYPHRLFAPPRNATSHLLPFNSSPTIVSNGAVFSMPIDSTHLLAHDAETGQPLRMLSREQLGSPTVLLGVRGELVLLAGEKDVSAFRWRDHDPLAPAPKPQWRTVVPSRRGRPLITANRLHVPTEKGLLSLDLDSGKPVTDPSDSLSRSLPAGNVLFDGSRLILVGADEVSACRLADPARR